MIARTETSELYLLCILDLFCVAIAPFDGYIRVRICIDQHVEGAVAVKYGQEGDRGSDLAENSLDLFLDLLFGLL